jgi:hypothetical protein
MHEKSIFCNFSTTVSRRCKRDWFLSRFDPKQKLEPHKLFGSATQSRLDHDEVKNTAVQR